MDARTPDGSGHRSPDVTRLEVRHEGHVVASAEVRSPAEPHGTARVSLQRHGDDAPAEARGELVDQVLDSPGVSAGDAVHVVLPLGDSASITRLQERTSGFSARAAGASSVVDADVTGPADAASSPPPA